MIMGTLTEEDACKQAFVMAIRDALNVISGKWKLAIVCALLTGERRFNEIERLLKDITPRMLARELKELEINGVVSKRQIQDNNKDVQVYVLTDSGQKLQDVIIQMAQWGVDHRKAICT